MCVKNLALKSINHLSVNRKKSKLRAFSDFMQNNIKKLDFLIVIVTYLDFE